MANAGDGGSSSGSASGAAATSPGSGGSGASTGGIAASGTSGASGAPSGGSTGASGDAGAGSSGAAGSSGDSGAGLDASSPADGAAEGGSASSGSPSGGVLVGDAGAKLVSLFDGTTLNGWVQVPAASWSVVNGAMHSLGPARGLIYTTGTYGDFRLVFASRLISDPAAHNPCVLFWGNSIGRDALGAIQIQPPKGYMWDYRTTGPTANKSPDMFETKLPHPNLVSTQWSQCEMLANQASGTLRFACCQLTGTLPCKATEIVDFHDPSAGVKAPLALQVHNANMIEEFKDLYVESPVADPTRLITTQ